MAHLPYQGDTEEQLCYVCGQPVMPNQPCVLELGELYHTECRNEQLEIERLQEEGQPFGAEDGECYDKRIANSVCS